MSTTEDDPNRAFARALFAKPDEPTFSDNNDDGDDDADDTIETIADRLFTRLLFTNEGND